MIALAPTQILLAQATVLGSYQEGHWLKCIPSFSVAAFMGSGERLLAKYWSALASYRTVIAKHQQDRVSGNFR